MLVTEICRHLWLSRNQKFFSNLQVEVTVHSRVRNTLDKAISQWKESAADPPPEQWLQIAKTLQEAIATSMKTRIERWLDSVLENIQVPEGRSEAPHTKEAATGLDRTQPSHVRVEHVLGY